MYVCVIRSRAGTWFSCLPERMGPSHGPLVLPYHLSQHLAPPGTLCVFASSLLRTSAPRGQDLVCFVHSTVPSTKHVLGTSGHSVE